VEFAPGGKLVGKVFFVADPDGYEIESLQRGGPVQAIAGAVGQRRLASCMGGTQ